MQKYNAIIAGSNASYLDGYPPAVYIQAQPNLLINTDYRFSINQRQQMNYNGKQYTLDMLYSGLDAGSVTVKNGYMTLGPNAWYCWPLEDRRYAGVPLTLAVQLADGTLITGAATYPLETTDATAFPFASNNKMMLSIQRHYTEGSLRVVLHVYEEPVSITRVKLELGEMFTGFTLTDPAVELVKCQRYQVNLLANTSMVHLGTGIASNPDSLYIDVTLPIPMRATPRAVMTGWYLWDSYANIPVQNIEVSGYGTGRVSLKCTATGSLTPTRAYKLYTLNQPPATALLDANL